MSEADDPVARVRAFNRYYTEIVGLLREGLLDTPYSLTEARIIFELAQSDAVEVADLRRSLDLDAGYVSRLLARFERDGLITRERAEHDRRRQVARLTPRGREAFELLDSRSAGSTAALLDGLPEADRRRLLAAMDTIRAVLEPAAPPEPFVLRPPRAGEYGWIVHRHGAVYHDEYRWDETFEALVARIVADHLETRDPDREATWIADIDGDPVGSVLCVRRDEHTAQLRLLLVEPSARGQGIGRRLVDECVRFARHAGYREMTLWTNDVLHAARRIYEATGFELVEEEPHTSFGHDLVGQYWRLDLTGR